MKIGAFTLLFVYSLNFAAGYYAVRAHDKSESMKACERILSEAHGWTLLGVIAVMPGEANACLDIGAFPRTRQDTQPK